MNKLVFTLLFICCVLKVQAQRLSGTVTDEKDTPLPFATVAIINLADSTLLTCCLTDNDGCFDIEEANTDVMIRISMVGYEMQSFVKPFPKHIRMKPTSQELGEVVVTAVRKFVKMSNRGLVVNMEGNPLAKLPSVEDAIKQMPMIDPVSGTVLGKGSPEIYINKRKVRDGNEIKQLSPEKVRSVEIITRPGARYNSDVRAVIIIHTKKLDEGLAGVFTGTGTLSEVHSGEANASLSYMFHNGLGIYGGASVGSQGFNQNRTYTEMFNNYAFHTTTEGKYNSRTESLKANFGTSYDFSANKSIGVRYEFSRIPNTHYKAAADFFTNALAEATEAKSLSESRSQSYQHTMNAYSYMSFGKRKNFDFALDADYIYGSNGQSADNNETLRNSLWNMKTDNNNAYHIFASKASLNMTFGKLAAEVGLQYSYTKNNMRFNSTGSDNNSFLKLSTDQESQHLYASYFTLAYGLNDNWSVNGGLRLENTAFNYEQNGVEIKEQSKTFTDVLPTLGVTYQKGNVGVGLAYSSNINRPSYNMLNNNYTYVSHTSWETGNPFLKPALTHSLELSLQCKQTMLTACYNRNVRAINTVYTFLPAENVNLRQEINLPDYDSYLFVASHSFNIGLWHPMLQGVLMFQNLKYGTDNQSYDKPLGKITLSNRLDLPWSLYAYVGASWTSKGHQATIYSEGDFSFYIMLNKNIKNWSFNLLFNDVANTYRQKSVCNTNGVSYREHRKGASQIIQLSVSYSFKQKKSFKGKGAAQEELQRF